ncbi:histidinol-phosphate transaminase [Pseudozobellia thermophila]|uniref:Histidinol-phosphate aminotransferase n=1 Tax=Pseudozobellia thermophila TaxID=192903 RepID=A0A1M6EVR5_9FLAO|nr:histidinol-phosphate transaminase [Pseudozobellia thermophila]SHI89508.1 histidinol-phosphate aminotransferase [Pseudozobellia thermophila]
MGFSLDNIIRENVKGLKPYSSARDEYVSDGSGMVFLDANENPFENGVNRYPDPQQRSLKAVLADQKGIGPKNMLLGNGSDEVLDLLYRGFCEPRVDNIITMPPTYGMYKVLADINAIENREVLLTEGFEPDVAGILKTVDQRTKLIFVCSPNNPTGNSFQAEGIVALLKGFDGLVVVDEAYIDFANGASWVSRLSEFPNLVVTQTLSKAYGMAGIRLGICMASEEIIEVLNKIKPPYNVNELTQSRALRRVSNASRIESEVREILEQKDLLLKVLPKIECIEKIYPSDANFILVRVDDANKRYNELLKMGVVVRNRSSQPLCGNTLRLTIGTKYENIKLVTALKSLS